MYNPAAASYHDRIATLANHDRRERERQANLERFIDYNNRRVAAGLRPLEIPPALLIILDWQTPDHRDRITLTYR